MEAVHKLQFETPGFFQRIKSMLGVDFYRLFHTPLLYIFLAIAAIIPAMVMGTSGTEGTETVAMYTNAWQMVASETPMYVVSNIGEYANMEISAVSRQIFIFIFWIPDAGI